MMSNGNQTKSLFWLKLWRYFLGYISIGNTSSNHSLSGDLLVFRGVTSVWEKRVKVVSSRDSARCFWPIKHTLWRWVPVGKCCYLPWKIEGLQLDKTSWTNSLIETSPASETATNEHGNFGIFKHPPLNVVEHYGNIMEIHLNNRSCQTVLGQ